MSSMDFALDVNQLSVIPKKHDLDGFQYADDVTIRLSFDKDEDFNNVRNKTLGCLNDILENSMYHGLALNSNKTQGLIVAKKATRQKWQSLSINFDGKDITFSNEMETLRAIIPLICHKTRLLKKKCIQMH